MSLDGFNARALLNELRQLALGARLQKFSQLTESDFLAHLRSPGRTDRVLFSTHQNRSRFHLLESPSSPAIVPNSFVMLCRKHIGGTRIQALLQGGLDRRIELQFSSGFSLVFDWSGRPSALLLIKSEERTICGASSLKGRFRIRQAYTLAETSKLTPLEMGAEETWVQLSSSNDTDIRDSLMRLQRDWSPLWLRRFTQLCGSSQVNEIQKTTFLLAWAKVIEPLNNMDPEYSPAIEADGELSYCAQKASFPRLHGAANQRWKESNQAPGASDFRSELLKRLNKGRKKALRKLEKRKKDKQGAESAPKDQMRGDLLLAYAAGIKKGLQNFKTQDWEGQTVTISLDPKLGPMENAERYYNKSKKKSLIKNPLN